MSTKLDFEMAKFFHEIGMHSHEIMLTLIMLDSGYTLGTALYEVLILNEKE